MNCEEFKKLIDTYLEKDLAKEISEKFEQHFSCCTKCCNELKSIDKCINIMQKMYKEADPPDTIRKNVFNKCCGGEK